MLRILSVATAIALVITSPSSLASQTNHEPKPATSAAPTATADTDPTLVRGSSITIRKSDFEQEAKSIPPDQRGLLWTSLERIQRTLERMLVNRAMLEEAQKSGFDRDPLVIAELQHNWNQKLVSLYVAKFTADLKIPDFEPTMRERYKLQQEKYQEPERVRAAHILVTTANRTPAEARARAEEARAKALNGDDFRELVKKYSEDPSARRNDGDVGYFAKEQMAAEFSAAVFAMKKAGDIGPVVQTEFGFHVIKFVERRPARTISYEEVRPVLLEEVTRDYQAQQLRLKLDSLVTEQKPQANMAELQKLLDNDTARAMKGWNEKVKREIEASQAKKQN